MSLHETDNSISEDGDDNKISLSLITSRISLQKSIAKELNFNDDGLKITQVWDKNDPDFNLKVTKNISKCYKNLKKLQVKTKYQYKLKTIWL